MDIQAEQAKRLDLAFCFFEKLCSLSFLLTVKAPIIVRGNDMCRISVSYDTAKRDIVKKNLEGSVVSIQVRKRQTKADKAIMRLIDRVYPNMP